MNRLTILGICGTLISTAACQPAYEKDYPTDPSYKHSEMMNPKVGHMFNEIDSNNDGVITLGESNLFAKSMFIESDLNRDGVVTRDEFSEHHRMNKAERMNNRNSNYKSNNYQSNRTAVRYDNDNVTQPYGADYYYNERYDRWERR